MPISVDVETGKAGVICEEGRFNHLLVSGPSGSGKTSLVFEPNMAKDIDKKFFFRNASKELGFAALKSGIATLNCPYSNDYINKNFSPDKIALFKI
jgi:DNA polymerase III delta prime subunit